MKNILLRTVSACLLATSPLAAGDPPPFTPSTIEVAEDFYMLVGYGANLGLLVGDDAAFMIDNQFTEIGDTKALTFLTGKIKEAIAEITDKPIKYVINTHYHHDHIGGNADMRENGTIVISHDNVRKRMAEGVPAGRTAMPPWPEAMLPTVTFSEAMTFHFDEHDIEVEYLADAHTDGDAIIFIKDLNVVLMGDVFINGGYTFIDLDAGGTLDGYLEVNEKVLAFADENTKIIPGHGPLGSKADLQKAHDLLKLIKYRVQALIEKGLSEEEVVKLDPFKEYHNTWGNGYVNGEWMTRFAYRAIKQAM